MMNKTKWIVGLSIASVMALSGTAFALNSGSVVAQSVGQTLGLVPTVATTQYQGTVADTYGINTVNTSSPTTSQSINTTPSSTNNNSNVVTTPDANGNGGGYGMMGGFGGNGNGGGYGMMGGFGGNGNGGGYGMMGGFGGNGNGGGYGMMGGFGGNGNGRGYGMMGGGYNAQSLGVNLTNSEVATSDQAVAIAKAYIQKLNQDVVVAELHEFSNGYEVELKEGKTGAKAYEVMIYKNGGQIIAEMGPNIMWNTKYGPMNWGNTGAVTVSEEQATKSAQEFVSKMGQGYSIGKPELAPGYYEFMVQKDGKDYAELDVNGYTGQVWFENWQGPILNTIDVK
ncbi:peptidase [Desulfosporosinus metallidurans]|uniref:DNA polymerase III alpha subunit n=1 Tax=Desulfosporosinus metallidurans TaxID=1888891 RepID=A0A1Q8QN77_9FIRM|nr:peptidase [Desulfosporosinus metallidurans]OLN28787.1 DNA polymerase III alpha subunit [Desulfosporosinus metallidurans]